MNGWWEESIVCAKAQSSEKAETVGYLQEGRVADTGVGSRGRTRSCQGQQAEPRGECGRLGVPEGFRWGSYVSRFGF